MSTHAALDRPVWDSWYLYCYCYCYKDFPATRGHRQPLRYIIAAPLPQDTAQSMTPIGHGVTHAHPYTPHVTILLLICESS